MFLGTAMCACTGQDSSTPETSDEWDMMSYAELDDIISVKEVDDERPDVKTWMI